MKYDLSTIGEGQIRITVPQGERLNSTRNLRMTAAGSEANVAGLLAQLGRNTTWGTILPRGPVARRVISEYRASGMNMDNVKRVEEGRVALYFLEPGEPPMPGRVIYDRLHTPFRSAKPEDFNWGDLLDTEIFFLTGITAALTEDTANIVQFAARQGKERGIKLVLDVNHRTTLWSNEDAGRVLTPIAELADLLLCSRKDAAAVFGIEADGVEVSQKLRERFGSTHVVSTDGVRGVYMSSESEGEDTFAVSRVPVIDRPGAGDSFVAGTIHGYLNDDVRSGISYGQRTSAFALTHHGDLTTLSPRELDIPITDDIVR